MEPQKIHTAEIVPQQQTALSRSTSMEATIASAVEAQSRAMVQARYFLAIRNPRDMDMVRQKLLQECARPGFAQVARYAKKQGKTQNDAGEWVDNYVTGPSIRFAEAAVRFFGNVLSEESVIHDDDERRVMRVSATDLEANLSYFTDVVVMKAVERSNAKGREVISQRVNSYNKITFLVKATDDETQQHQASLISKALRKQVLRMLPRDIVDECMETVIEVQTNADAQHPDAQRNKVFDAFAVIGVSAAAIKEYIGHEIGKEDLPLLRAIIQTLKQGDAKWSELIAEKRAADAAESDAATPLADRLKAQALKLVKGESKKPVATDPPPAAAENPKPTPEDLAAIATWSVELETATDLPGLLEVKDKAQQVLSSAALQEFMRRYIAACDRVRQGH